MYRYAWCHATLKTAKETRQEDCFTERQKYECCFPFSSGQLCVKHEIGPLVIWETNQYTYK